ncbi:hypothetical protein [Cedecea neteri]|uniref:hypothetical protein n=1 Tax=Cedecea neteri TaxID=158822 RepID=UPI0028993C4E|nr:hypothetical protein [Cedecea neteri]
MPTETIGAFEIEYKLITRHDNHGGDYQFGMEFKLSNRTGRPMCQLIYPATPVGNNHTGQWNIDNHQQPGDITSLYYHGSEKGTIVDTPREISHFGQGVKKTKFTVYAIDPDKAELLGNGVTFGYYINTSQNGEVTTFLEMKSHIVTNEEIALIKQACNFIKIIK